MVEFCPNCGSILVPKKGEKGTSLYCIKCGYSKPLVSDRGYKSKRKVEEEEKVKILVAEATRPRDRERIREEKELLQEYYEILLESMQEQEEAET